MQSSCNLFLIKDEDKSKQCHHRTSGGVRRPSPSPFLRRAEAMPRSSRRRLPARSPPRPPRTLWALRTKATRRRQVSAGCRGCAAGGSASSNRYSEPQGDSRRRAPPTPRSSTEPSPSSAIKPRAAMATEGGRPAGRERQGRAAQLPQHAPPLELFIYVFIFLIWLFGGNDPFVRLPLAAATPAVFVAAFLRRRLGGGAVRKAGK